MKQLDRIEFYLRSLLEVSMFSSKTVFPEIDKKLDKLDEELRIEAYSINLKKWEAHSQKVMGSCMYFLRHKVEKYLASVNSNYVNAAIGWNGFTTHYVPKIDCAETFAAVLTGVEIGKTIIPNANGLELYKWLDEVAIDKTGALRD